MNKKYALALTVLLFSAIIYSCTKDDHLAGSNSRNSELILFERAVTTVSNSITSSPSIELDGNLKKTVQIKYENDNLENIRKDIQWLKFIENNKFNIDREHIKKSSIDKTSVVLFSIPFNKGGTSGFINLYQLKDKFFWTVTTIENLGGGSKKYHITSRDGGFVMRITVDREENISDFSSLSNENLKSDYAAFSKTEGQTVINADDDSISPEPIGGGGADCFKNHTYYQCLQCIIVDHCGNDLACTLACGAFPEVCLGIAILACLP